jgi:membrane fusion protein (multidrug efflux system)
MPIPSLRIITLSFLSVIALSATAQAQPQAVDVIVQSVQQQSLQTRIEALGSLRANESIRLTSNVTKTVTRINFDDGQRVQKGDVLVEMTSAEEQALFDEARFNTDEAKKQLDRVRSLVANGAASESLLDQRIREYESARARSAALESRLKDLRLNAPFDGAVGLRNISVGALVSPGDLITTLNDDSKMKLDFTVPALFLRSLRTGLPITANSHDLGDKSFAGEIYSIDNQIDPVTRAITVRALLPNPEQELRQGMLMLVELYADQRNALIVSESALVPLGGSNFVFVIQQQDSATNVVRKEIQIGQRMQGYVEVLSGLELGDKVVTHGLQKIRSGQQVRIAAEESGQESLVELLNNKNS